MRWFLLLLLTGPVWAHPHAHCQGITPHQVHRASNYYYGNGGYGYGYASAGYASAAAPTQPPRGTLPTYRNPSPPTNSIPGYQIRTNSHYRTPTLASYGR